MGFVTPQHLAALRRLTSGPVPVDALSEAEKCLLGDCWRLNLCVARGTIRLREGAVMEVTVEEFALDAMGVALLAEQTPVKLRPPTVH